MKPTPAQLRGLQAAKDLGAANRYTRPGSVLGWSTHWWQASRYQVLYNMIALGWLTQAYELTDAGRAILEPSK